MNVAVFGSARSKATEREGVVEEGGDIPVYVPTVGVIKLTFPQLRALFHTCYWAMYGYISEMERAGLWPFGSRGRRERG